MSTETNGKNTFLMLGSAVSAMAVLVAGCWVIISLKIENAVAVATADRNNELAALRSTVEGNKAIEDAKSIEVETQIDSMAQSLSIQFAEQQRFDSGVQSSLHDLGALYPTAASGPWYFPNISNRNAHQKK